MKAFLSLTDEGNNICVYLEEGDALRFDTTTSATWYDYNYEAISVKSNFKIAFESTPEESERAIYAPAEYIELAAGEGNTAPDFSAGVFRTDAAYYSSRFLNMKKIMSNSFEVTVGDIADHDNWFRYCSFVVARNNTRIISKMVTGIRGSGNRIVFMAPETGYYEIAPRALSNTDESSVKLSIGSYAEDFGTNTASFKVINPQTDETYTDVTLYAADENGESRYTGEIENTKNIYLRKGERLYFQTSTSIDWFDMGMSQTVSVVFDFEIYMTERAAVQRTYLVTHKPGTNFGYTSAFTAKTKYLGGDWTDINCTRELENSHVLLGYDGNVNWDKYAAFEADNENNIIISKLVGKDCANQLIFTVPEDGKYSFSGGNAVSLELGNYAEHFSDTDSATLTITSDFAEAEEFSDVIVLTKENAEKTRIVPTDIELKAGDTVTFTFTTTAEWFDNPEYQTVSIVMNLAVNGMISTDKYADRVVFAPADTIRLAASGVPSLSAVTTGDSHIIDYTGYAYKTYNHYYSFSDTNQYGAIVDGILYTYGYNYQNGSEGRGNELLRGSFKIGGDNDDLITGITARAGEESKQTVTFTAPQTGLYALNPIAVSADESAWIKNYNTNNNGAKAKLVIKKNNQITVFESEELSLNESQTTAHSFMLYLEEGDEITFDFVGVDTTWNTDLRLGVNFNLTLIERAE